MSWATSLLPSLDQGNKFAAQLALIQYELGDKFVAHIGAGRQVCRPSRAELGLKDWAILVDSARGALPRGNCSCAFVGRQKIRPVELM
jgi:hypothetical protein